jgi:hypothetical protein
VAHLTAYCSVADDVQKSACATTKPWPADPRNIFLIYLEERADGSKHLIHGVLAKERWGAACYHERLSDDARAIIHSNP